MRIAYLVLAHHLPEQVARLVGRLASPSAAFFVHVDRNASDATRDAIASGASGYGAVYFLPRHATSWGGWGIVEATVEGLNQIVRTGLQPDVVVLLSGQDYPLRRPDEIEAFFAERRGESFVDLRRLPDYRWNSHGAYDRFGGRPLPQGMAPYGGSMWWALSGDCAAYVAGAANGNDELTRYFAGVGIPDEHFVHTVVANSPFRDRVSSLRGDHVLGVHYVDWHRGPPKVLGTDDLDRLAATDALFARKFDASRDAAVLDAIDARLDTGGSPPGDRPDADEAGAADGIALLDRLERELRREFAALGAIEDAARELRATLDGRASHGSGKPTKRPKKRARRC